MSLKAFTVLSISVLVVLSVTSVWASFAATDVFLPSVGSGPGAAGSQWFTTVWIHNPGPADANLQVSFLERGNTNPSPQVFNEFIPAGETVRAVDIIGSIFGMSNAFGALRVQSDQRLLVNSRIYSQPPGGGDPDTVGQFFAAVPATFAIGSGQSTEVLGVFQMTPTAGSPYRYNFGFVETTGSSVTVRVSAMDPAGNPVATMDYPLGAHGVAQYGISSLVAGIQAENLRLHFEVVGGAGRVVTFGSGLANATNDPSTFEMMFRDELLGGSGGGLQTVSHDSSLAGDGTPSSPLAIASSGVGTAHLANAAVTAQKIGATGSSAGQVLSSDGSTVSWQTPAGGGGLSLPFTGSGASSQALMSITNQADGPAMVGRHGETGNYAELGKGEQSIHAVAFYGSGIYAQSTRGDGVVSETSASAKSGIYGVSSVADGFGVYGHNAAAGNHGHLAGRNPDGNDVGVFGAGEWGVDGRSTGSYGAGVRGLASGFAGHGVAGVAQGASGAGVFGTSSLGLAGLFEGDVEVTGGLSKGGGAFKIDHPLDVENKFLYHSFVESPDMMNVYNGNLRLDGRGEAWVELPEWFQALNREFRYQLTAIGAPAPDLHVAEEIAGNRFRVAGGEAGMKVSWQVTGIRQDAWANANRIPVEEDKDASERGLFLHAEAHGYPPERAISHLRGAHSGL